MAKNYKDAYTLDGRVKFQPGVSKEKLRATKKLVEAAQRGDNIAVGTLQEAMTTSDLPFNLAQLVNLDIYDQFDEAERTWTQIAGRRTSGKLSGIRLWSLNRQWNDGVLGDGDPTHVAPVVPEGSAYPESTMSGEEGQTANIVKRGFKTAWTMEAFHEDPVGFIEAFPQEMLRVALDTEEYEVYGALIDNLTAAQQLQAGTVAETGDTVAANAALSRAALTAGLYQLKNRKFNGRKIQITGRINLVVPVGKGDFARFLINVLAPVSVDDGPIRYAVSNYSPLSGLNVVESEYVTGNAWYLIPAPGAVRRPVLEHITWSVQPAPEVRVSNFTGTYVGGGAVSPFEGSFDNDSSEFRLRQFGGASLWTPNAVLWSTGTGTTP